jgi:uncharacterized protein YndB with AHSA1/START domain
MTDERPWRVTVRRTIAATARRLYAAWTDAELLSSWFSDNVESDAVVGGKYKNDDNDSGAYLELIPSRKVHMTWDNAKAGKGSLLTVTFRPDGTGRTVVQITHANLRTEKEIPGFREGWNWALDALRAFVENGQRIRYSEWVELREKRASKRRKR